jgi:hypothetical protein
VEGATMSDHDEPATCPECGADLEWADCWQCHGEGGWHDCGEDCCCCLDKETIDVECDICEGEGGYLQCDSLPHSEEQMRVYRERQVEAGE